MEISLRSVLTAGVATITASAVALAPAIQPLPAAATATAPANIEIAASSQPWLPANTPISAEDLNVLISWAELFVPSLNAPFPTPIPNDAVQGTGINDSIKSIYYVVEPWVEWGFDVAAYAVGWIPWVGWIAAPQINMLYDFGEKIVRTLTFNISDWLFGSLGFNQGLSNVVRDIWDASWQLAGAEIRWLIPNFPLPPLPPCPPILCGGNLGGLVVTASGWLRDGSLWIWDLWHNPIKPVIDGGIGIANNVFDALNWVPFVPLIKFETNSIWGLVQGLGDPLVGFAQDMIIAGDKVVSDFLFDAGLVEVAVNATEATWNSIVSRIGEALNAGGVFLQDQWDYFTGGFLEQGLSSAVSLQRVGATGGFASTFGNLQAALSGDVGDLGASFDGELAKLRGAAKENIANLRASFGADIADLRAAVRGEVAAGTATIDSLKDSVTAAFTPGTPGADRSVTQSDGLRNVGPSGYRHLRGLVGIGDGGGTGRGSTPDVAGSADDKAATGTGRGSTPDVAGSPDDNASGTTGGSDIQPKKFARTAKLRPTHHLDGAAPGDSKRVDAPTRGEKAKTTSDAAGASSGKQEKSRLKRRSLASA